MAFDKQASAGYLTNHMARLFARGLHDRIRPLGLAPAQFAVLLELWAGDGLTQKELVERRPLPGDRRAQTVHLTARGRALEAPATQAATATNDAALADLNLAERLQFLNLMRRVIATLRRPALRRVRPPISSP